MFDDFNSPFDDMFNLLMNNFSRPVKDMQPFKAFKVDKGYLIVVNTLGIDKKDLSVNLEKQKGRAYPILKIVGETNLDKIDFKNKVNLGISLKFDEDIKGISYKCENGLTKILIEVSQPEREQSITATLVDGDDGSLDW